MKRIIIVDDDNAIQDVMQLIFSGLSYQVTVYRTGTALLNLDFELPDAFLLDKQLPGINGLDICRFLKSQEKIRDIPVIILSATTHLDAEASAAGADDFMEKPFRIKDLIEKVERLTTRVS